MAHPSSVLLHRTLLRNCLPALLLVLSCSSGGNIGERFPGSQRCERESDCPAGSLCIQKVCRAVCVVDSDCPNTQVCIAGGLCVASEPPRPCQNDSDCTDKDQVCSDNICIVAPIDPPVIESINGSGSIDPNPDHAERHIHDRLVVSGQNLAGATFTLTQSGAGSSGVSLERCNEGSDTNQRVEVSLPTDLVDGDYTLTVANQAGLLRQLSAHSSGRSGEV